MAISLKNGAVFLHIPKTGGNWVTAVLRDLDLVKEEVGHKHADFEHLFVPCDRRQNVILKRVARKLLPVPRNKPFMFCFTRNPLSWYESWFKYMSQPRRQWQNWGDEHDTHDWHPNAVLNGLGSPDFNQFVRNVIQKRPGYVTELYASYVRPQMDFVGKQETLVDDFIRVLRVMNLDVDEEFIRNYKRVGVSPDIAKEIIWEDGLKKSVALLEYSGLIRYGYSTEIVDECFSPAMRDQGNLRGVSEQTATPTFDTARGNARKIA